MLVRAARPGDEAALVRSALGNARESEGIELDAAFVARAVGRLLADPAKGRAFVAEEDGHVVGSLFVTFEWSDWHDAWYWWLQSVYVVPERRGRGVYSRLYQAVREAAVREGGVRSVRLYVESRNEAALRAYRGHGMSETAYRVFDHPL